MKKYDRNNKKHKFNDSLFLVSFMFHQLLGHKLRLIGESKQNPYNADFPRIWIVYSMHKEIKVYTWAHWWRGNQR